MLAEVDQGFIARRQGVAPQGELIHASADGPGIQRKRAGKGFSYVGPLGVRITDKTVLKRIRGLVIPPAWRNVWICPDANGHIQAIGYDDRGRRQYRYHPRFREQRDSAKFERLIEFAEILPMLRAQVAADMRAHGLGRDKVLATVVYLLETTMIRVGNATYAKENKSYGLTTLRNRHVKIVGGELRFDFKGKSGKIWRLNMQDRRVARIVRACQELPGQHLFQYLDDAGERRTVSSEDVNGYLKAVSGRDITAKDFRTWAGTVLAARALAQADVAESATAAKRALNAAVKLTAAKLGNTPAICRKSYIHPQILSAYLDGGLPLDIAEDEIEVCVGALRPDEAAVLAFLKSLNGERDDHGPSRVVQGPWPGLEAAAH